MLHKALGFAVQFYLDVKLSRSSLAFDASSLAPTHAPFTSIWSNKMLKVDPYPEVPEEPHLKKHFFVDPRDWMPNISPPPTLDTYLGIEDLCELYGYKAVRHEATTDDGYILTIFRISKANTSASGNTTTTYPVFFQHGFSGSCSNWLNNGENSLPFVMLESGPYDVWCGNFRGNTYSRGHVKYTRQEEEYWNFSVQDHAMSDYPAQVGYIYNTTKQKVSVIAHSMGTLTMYWWSAEKSQQVEQMVATFSGMGNLLLFNITEYQSAKPLTGGDDKDSDNGLILQWGNREMLGYEGMLSRTTRFLSTYWSSMEFTEHVEYESRKAWQRYNRGHSLDGVALKTMVHLNQVQVANQLQYYDYGEAVNLQKYNATLPPRVPLENLKTIKLPIAMFSAYWDKLTSYAQSQAINDFIGDNVKVYHVQRGGHEVFLWPRDLGWFKNVTLPFIDKGLIECPENGTHYFPKGRYADEIAAKKDSPQLEKIDKNNGVLVKKDGTREVIQDGKIVEINGESVEAKDATREEKEQLKKEEEERNKQIEEKEPCTGFFC